MCWTIRASPSSRSCSPQIGRSCSGLQESQNITNKISPRAHSKWGGTSSSQTCSPHIGRSCSGLQETQLRHHHELIQNWKELPGRQNTDFTPRRRWSAARMLQLTASSRQGVTITVSNPRLAVPKMSGSTLCTTSSEKVLQIISTNLWISTEILRYDTEALTDGLQDIRRLWLLGYRGGLFLSNHSVGGRERTWGAYRFHLRRRVPGIHCRFGVYVILGCK